MKEPHSWKAAERSSVPGWFLHTSAFECAPTIYKDTQCYILSHIKGCFIPAKSQSSPDRHDSGLNFISDVLTPDSQQVADLLLKLPGAGQLLSPL